MTVNHMPETHGIDISRRLAYTLDHGNRPESQGKSMRKQRRANRLRVCSCQRMLLIYSIGNFLLSRDVERDTHAGGTRVLVFQNKQGACVSHKV